MEDLRRTILQIMQEDLDEGELHKLELVLDMNFNDYNITKKSRELTVSQDPSYTIVNNFLGVKKLGGLSDRTIDHYRHTIKTLLDDVGKDVREITTNDLRQHLAKWQVERKVSTVTTNHMRRVYKSFFGWLYKEEYIPKDPTKRLESVKTPKRKVKPFTETELELMFSECSDVRERALLEFLYSTGVRAEECKNVNLNDIDFYRGEVIIRSGKGSKERTTYLTEVATLWLKKYLETRSDNDIALFMGKRGRLSVRGIEVIVKRIAEKAGVEGAHPHRFRHTLASKMIERGAPVTVVKEILGHESLDTTMIYVTLNDEEIKNAHNKLIA